MRTLFKNYWILIFIILIYFGLLIFYFKRFSNGLSISNGDWGTFGDFFGGTLSPIIGIISIYLTYNIIYNQIKENKQAEFKYIFQLLFDKLDTQREAINWKQNRKEYQGAKAISRINRDIELLYNSLQKNNSNKEDLELFDEAFWSVHEDINRSSSPYMKVLHNCLKAIDRNCIEERKEEYSSLLRAQLNSDELVFIFYNSIASPDFQNFKNRVEKFTILKDVESYPFPIELKSLFNEIAFLENSKKMQSINYKNKVFSIDLNFTISKR